MTDCYNTNDKMVTAPLFAGSTYYYASLLKPNEVYFDINIPYNKMWAINRCNILSANGIQTLTVPLVKPKYGAKTPLKDLEISTHGNWEHLHWGALFSAYGKTPFFEYIEADLHHIFENHSKWLIDFNFSIHQFVVDLMQLPIKNAVSPENGLIMPNELTTKNLDMEQTVPYYQLWQERYNFVPGLSIIDLFMNEGPHGIFTLNQIKKLIEI